MMQFSTLLCAASPVSPASECAPGLNDSESFDISVVLLSTNKNPFNWSNHNLTTSLNSNGGLLAISLLLLITATDLVVQFSQDIIVKNIFLRGVYSWSLQN